MPEENVTVSSSDLMDMLRECESELSVPRHIYDALMNVIRPSAQREQARLREVMRREWEQLTPSEQASRRRRLETDWGPDGIWGRPSVFAQLAGNGKMSQIPVIGEQKLEDERKETKCPNNP